MNQLSRCYQLKCLKGLDSVSGQATGHISGQATLSSGQCQQLSKPGSTMLEMHELFMDYGGSIRRSLEELHMHQAWCEHNPFDQEWIWTCKENFDRS